MAGRRKDNGDLRGHQHTHVADGRSTQPRPGYEQEIGLLKSREVQDYVDKHQDEEPDSLAFAIQKKGWPVHLIIEQLKARKKVREKFEQPYFSVPFALFPDSLIAEQASSAATAYYKRQLVPPTVRCLLDTTGGLGVDTYAFAQKVERVIYNEPSPKRLAYARANLSSFSNIFYNNEDAARLLDKDMDSKLDCDAFFLDPDRRPKGERSFGLEESTPNILELWPRLKNTFSYALVKLSPMLDLHQLSRALPNLTALHVVAHGKEVKEIVAEYDTAQRGLRLHLVHLQTDSCHRLSFDFPDKAEDKPAPQWQQDLEPNLYLHEATAPMRKWGRYGLLAERFGLQILDARLPYFVGRHALTDWPGRIFKLDQTVPLKKKKLGPIISGGRATVVARNFPQASAQLQNKLGLTHGTEREPFVLAFSAQGKKQAWLADKVDPLSGKPLKPRR